MSLCRKKKTMESATQTATGRVAGERGQLGAGFPRVAQQVPAVREISGQKKYQQQADDFDRLKAQQIHFGVARARAAAERDQQGGKGETRNQRDKAQPPHQVFVIDQRGGGHQQRSHGRALGEIGEQQIVAHRVAQRHHQHQPRSREQHDHRQQRFVA
jgi:hypothetical protein